MTGEAGTGGLVDLASSGVEGLASLATSALGQSGPAGALVQPVVGVLRNVWEGYFGVPIPQGTTNWNAYTHQQLYDMIWNNADVGDVSSVAADWSTHSSELADNASSVRTQRTALQSNWTGGAAEPAADRLGELGDRLAGIGTRAGTVAQATQNAGDALAVARNTMPPPPGDPTGLVVTSAVAGAGAGAAIGAVVGAGAGGVGAGPGALMGAAIGAVAAGGGSLFLANVTAAEQKAQAVQVMQTYEASLRHSGQAVAPTPPGATEASSFGAGSLTSTSGYVGPAGGGLGGTGAVPWQRLTGGASGAGLDAVRSGIGPAAGLLGPSSALPEELAAEQAAGGTGMMPGSGSRGTGEDDREHRNRLPTVDQQLFALDQRATSPVIGL
ncbi:MAG TPA: hypothetical protein VHX38_07205 [Pseudonocardiaceae bacterium]|nr:hypothetical protein [Pseudonocardiaceae bacterium]